jgi:hypothetical protein
MRRRELGSAMHQLYGILNRMQDPDAETKEDGHGQGKGLR